MLSLLVMNPMSILSLTWAKTGARLPGGCTALQIRPNPSTWTDTRAVPTWRSCRTMIPRSRPMCRTCRSTRSLPVLSYTRAKTIFPRRPDLRRTPLTFSPGTVRTWGKRRHPWSYLQRFGSILKALQCRRPCHRADP